MLHNFKLNLASVLFLLTLASCGGGGGDFIAGIGGTGVTSSGAISGFGSIFVNGVKFDTNNVSRVDGDLSQVSDLKLGMVVTVRGEVNDTDKTGTADTIHVDIEIQGPVANPPVLDTNTNNKSFNVLGRNIVINSNSTAFDGANFSFDTVSQNDVVEASGYIDANGSLQATRLEKKGVVSFGNTKVEVNGIVTATSVASFTLLVDSTSLTINNSGNITVPGGINVGVELEVKGTLNTATEIAADTINLDDDLFDSNDSEVEVEGYITNYISDSNFMVNGQLIDASSGSVTRSPATLILADNLKVEVEGNFSNGTLVATSVKARSGNIRMFSNVASDPANNQIILDYAGMSATPVTVDSQTKFEDDVLSGNLTLSGISSDDFLEILAINNNGTILATELKRKVDEADRETILRGAVSDIDTTTPGQESLTILDVVYNTDNNTSFEINDVSSTRNDFFNAVSVGSVVSIKEKKSSFNIDGIAESMDLKN